MYIISNLNLNFDEQKKDIHACIKHTTLNLKH